MEQQKLFRREADMAQWWQNHAPLGVPLQTTDGTPLIILFQGRPGAGKGPDFCDAAIELNGAALAGDIELHLLAGGWFSHGHAADPRYSRVILHVIAEPMPRAARGAITMLGAHIPALLANAALLQRSLAASLPEWPCQSGKISSVALRRLGEQRFQLKKQRFLLELRRSETPARDLETVLCKAMAAACVLGRDPLPARVVRSITKLQGAKGRDFGGADMAVAEDMEDVIAARRVSAIIKKNRAERQMAAWLCGAAFTQSPAQFWRTLRCWLADEAESAGNISAARADIIIWNGILPVLAAYASVCGAMRLENAALQCAMQAPGLQSNILTRYMKNLWCMRRLPSGAAAQQGMHAVYSGWCKEKRCETCPMAHLG